MGGPKKLNSRRSLGESLGREKILEAERRQIFDIPIELDKKLDLNHLKYRNNLVIRSQKGKLTWRNLRVFWEDQMDPKSAVGGPKLISRTGEGGSSCLKYQ